MQVRFGVLAIANNILFNKIRGYDMIELTKLNDIKFVVNAEIIEIIEETPDTVVTLTTGKKLIVKESRQEVVNLVILYKQLIFSNLHRIEG